METKAELAEQEKLFMMMKARREQIKSKLEKLEAEKAEILDRMDVCARAVDFVEQVSTEERKGIKEKVEELITSCLHEVFDDSYSVEFCYGVKRSKTSVEVYCTIKCEDGLTVKRQIDGIGGGVADAISLPLKLMVLLNEDKLDRVLVVDEPGKHLSVNHVPRFARFLQTVARRLGVQIIMSSHHAGMDKYADCVNEIHLEGSRSVVERIK
ncbi:MAG: hypothetical protein J6Y62_00575 [Clostridia bacterium]|nr:hypothetical protein [Clostridia bacterium]